MNTSLPTLRSTTWFQIKNSKFSTHTHTHTHKVKILTFFELLQIQKKGILLVMEMFSKSPLILRRICPFKLLLCSHWLRELFVGSKVKKKMGSLLVSPTYLCLGHLKRDKTTSFIQLKMLNQFGKKGNEWLSEPHQSGFVS